MEVGRRARAELEERVRDAAGVRRFATALAVLGTALDELGLADAVERRTVAPPEESS